MNRPYCYEYPRPSVTVDLVVFTLAPEGIRALFIRRKKDPFAGRWAIPGGFLEMEEAVDLAALRELREETGLADPQLVEPIGWFGDPGTTRGVAPSALPMRPWSAGRPRRWKAATMRARPRGWTSIRPWTLPLITTRS